MIRFINKIVNAQTHLLIGSFELLSQLHSSAIYATVLADSVPAMYSSTPARHAVVDTSSYNIYSVQHRGGI